MTRVLLGCALLATMGCATRSARLYDLDTAAVLHATYKRSTFGGKGPIWIGPTREQAECHGEYRTVGNDDVTWGTIYGAGQPITLIGGSGGGARRGAAIATCPGQRIITCEFLTSSGGGHGQCADNQGHRYRLMF